MAICNWVGIIFFQSAKNVSKQLRRGKREMKSFKDYYIGRLLHPRQTFEILLTDNRRLKSGLLAMSLNAVL